MNELVIELDGEWYLCRQFYDTDTDSTGVDVYKYPSNKHLIEIENLEIPCDDCEEEDKNDEIMDKFSNTIREALNNK
jgi:hypothetical protein